MGSNRTQLKRILELKILDKKKDLNENIELRILKKRI
jgi:hypothetical protein